MPRTRLERDSLGTVRVPATAYYGSQTQRAVENFPISGLRLQPEMVRAFALIKKASAQANAQLRLLPAPHARAIMRAADEVFAGKLSDQFVVDVYQAGAGTSLNMNMNEVLANRANQLLGRRLGTYTPLHPNDHVNMGQSTNDTFPTAMRLAALMSLAPLVDAMEQLEGSLARKARQFRGIVKSGRTHLQDAVPVRLGGEFAAYALAVQKARQAVAAHAVPLGELNLGGTATGTGLNAPPQMRFIAIRALKRWTKLPLRPGRHLQERMQSHADFARLSGTVRAYALELIRIANDLRLMASGPHTGFGEIDLPAIQPGSSIMPGKVNPVVPEMVDMVGFQVLGHDTTVALAVQAGQLELNVMMPVMAYNVLQPLRLLAAASRVLAEKCVDGITAHPARCAELAGQSLALVTALAPKIGYLNAAMLAKESLKTRRSMVDLVVQHRLLTPAQARRLLDPARLSQGGLIR